MDRRRTRPRRGGAGSRRDEAREGEETDLPAVDLDDHRLDCLRERLARADVLDALRVDVRDRVPERIGTVVHHVVVGQRDDMQSEPADVRRDRGVGSDVRELLDRLAA